MKKTARYSGWRRNAWVGAIARTTKRFGYARGAIVVNAEQGAFGSAWSRATGRALPNVRCSTMAPSPLPIKEVRRETMASILVYLCETKAHLLPYTAALYYIICTWYGILFARPTNRVSTNCNSPKLNCASTCRPSPPIPYSCCPITHGSPKYT